MTMGLFTKIAENKIREAMEAGAFDDLPGRGSPLVFEDETFIPEDLRMAYRVLKNAGCLPPELELRREAATLRELLSTLDDEQERLRTIRRIQFRLAQAGEMRKAPLRIEPFPAYEDRLYEKLSETTP